MRISDWSSDVCSSDLWARRQPFAKGIEMRQRAQLAVEHRAAGPQDEDEEVQIAEAELIPKRVATFPQTLVEQCQDVTQCDYPGGGNILLGLGAIGQPVTAENRAEGDMDRAGWQREPFRSPSP